MAFKEYYQKLMHKLGIKVKTTYPVSKKTTTEDEIKTYAEFLQDLGDNLQQKKAVVSDSKRILVLAGAGSGKTKVLTKRYIHLVKNKGVHHNNILALTFTKEAANEMARRIAKALDLKVENVRRNVRTFHSFGLSILRMSERFDIIDESSQREIIEDIVYDFRNNDAIMDNMYNYMRDYLVQKIKDKDNKSGREPQFNPKPKKFGERRIKTDSGEMVRSKSERDIANFLTSLGVKWEYEKPVNWSDTPFKPDFTVEDEIYIEHWCYNKDTPEFPMVNKKKYLEFRKKKEEQFKKHKKVLISVEETDMNDLLNLQVKLANTLKSNLKKEIKKLEILDLMQIKPLYRMVYIKFIDELIEIINLIKSQHMSINKVKELVGEQEKEKVIQFFNVLIPVLEEYTKILRRKDWGKKDFNDLIKDAVTLLQQNEERRKYYQNNIQYLLVDEYQDVSYGDVELLKSIVNRDTNLFAVGDDWQSIYGWRGSNVDFILNFDRDFGKCETIILPINYRSTRNIVLASNHFIQLGNRQIKKDISCCKEKMEDNSKIMQLNAEDDFHGANYVMSRVRKLMQDEPSLKPSDFLVVYRSSRIMHGYKKVFQSNKFKIPQHTIHWAKGTEFKYVFVLGLKEGSYGFPNVYVDKDIKRVIMDIPLEEKDDEERRLFYVAMTRAKNKLFLISERGNESMYVHQVPNDCKYVMESKVE